MLYSIFLKRKRFKLHLCLNLTKKMRYSQSLYLYLSDLKKYFNMNTNDNTTEFDAIVVGRELAAVGLQKN